MANDSASPTTDCIASVVSLGVHVIGRKRQVDCDGQKAGRKDALIGPLGGPSSYRPLSGRYLMCAGHGTHAEGRKATVIGRKANANKARAVSEMRRREEA